MTERRPRWRIGWWLAAVVVLIVLGIGVRIGVRIQNFRHLEAVVATVDGSIDVEPTWPAGWHGLTAVAG